MSRLRLQENGQCLPHMRELQSAENILIVKPLVALCVSRVEALGFATTRQSMQE